MKPAGFLFLLVTTTLLRCNAVIGQIKIPSDDPRIDKLLTQLTIEEKLKLLGGTGFETNPIPRLGIPALTMADGPVGVRWTKASAFPVSIMMAAGWDPSMVRRLGVALGQEAKAKGRRMLLGPCVNIDRVPFGGRSFESFGEDPWLAAQLTTAYVDGVQSEKVIATTKHFACNNQEFERDFTNVTVSERALREIYLPAFEAAVKAGRSWSVMSAYNKVNGVYCSENPHLLRDILKEEWNFRGFVVSDWSAVHSSVATAIAGLDVEMPTGKYLNADSLLPAIRAGVVTEEVVNDKIRRLLRAMIWAGLFDGGEKDKGSLNTSEHRKVALEVAREGIVLLKNERNILPLDRRTLKSLAVIGPNAAHARAGGGGSALVDPLYAIAPLEGLRRALGKTVAIRYAQGCRLPGQMDQIPSSALLPADGLQMSHGLKGEYFANVELQGTPVLTRIDPTVSFDWGQGSPDPSIPRDSFSVRWTGKLVPPYSGTYTLSVTSDDGVRLFVDGTKVIENWTKHAPEMVTWAMPMDSGRAYDIRMEYFEGMGGAMMRFGWNTADRSQIREAVEAARGADAAVVFAGLSSAYESEGFDRRTLTLPDEQEALIKAVAAVNKRTIVVLNSGAPVLMAGWVGAVPGLVEAWYPGEEGGNALADVLLGKFNPSGKLPVTFLKRWEDAPAYGHYPGNGGTEYAEGVFVGYRWYDQKNLAVEFPFGYGLSYTTFALSNLTITSTGSGSAMTVAVSLDVKNTGTRPGAEVVQVYVHDGHPAVERPPRELKAFQRVALAPNETKHIKLLLDQRAFAYYDDTHKDWQTSHGEYEIQVGTSSRDIMLKGTVTVR